MPDVNPIPSPPSAKRQTTTDEISNYLGPRTADSYNHLRLLAAGRASPNDLFERIEEIRSDLQTAKDDEQKQKLDNKKRQREAQRAAQLEAQRQALRKATSALSSSSSQPLTSEERLSIANNPLPQIPTYAEWATETYGAQLSETDPEKSKKKKRKSKHSSSAASGSREINRKRKRHKTSSSSHDETKKVKKT